MSGIADLQRHGYRRTAQRALILAILEASDGHLSAAQIADAVAGTDVALTRSTVYRTLETLVDIGVVRASQIGRSVLYEYVRGQQSHHHLVCNACQATVHIHETEVDTALTRAAGAQGFRVEEIQVLVGGLCRDCDPEVRGAGGGTISPPAGLNQV